MDDWDSSSSLSDEEESTFSEKEEKFSADNDTIYGNPGHDESDGAGEEGLHGGNIHPPEYYRQGILTPVQRDTYQRYAKKTRLRLREVEAMWEQFNDQVLKSENPFHSISIPIVENFLEWTICQKLGKNGRLKRGTKTSGSLQTRWKLLSIVYKVATGQNFKACIYEGISEVLQRLTEKYDLRTTRRRNRFMTVETLKAQIETTLSTTKKRFELGELRILAVLFLLLLAPGGSRPASILFLRFGDIKVTLARDPEGGPHNLIVKFTPEFTKTYLGAKESCTFTVPEGIFHRSLFLSTHVFLLAILFRCEAFQAPSLTQPEGIEQLTIHPGEDELPLPLKRELDDVFIFRQATKTPDGYETSANKPITYSMMRAWIVALGKIQGIECNVIMYSLRYLTGNKLDQSPNISDSLRNLSLGHTNSVPFQRHYLSREICADTFAIVLGETPNQALVTQSCSIAHSTSQRRPTKLTAEQVSTIENDPEIVKMRRRLQRMQPRSEPYKNTYRKLRNAKQRKANAMLQDVREEWTDIQAVEDIERQLRGEGFAPVPEDISAQLQHPAQKRMMEALTAEVQPTLEGQYRRRNRAIHALIAYCTVEEGPVARVRNGGAAKKSTARETAAHSALELATLSVFVSDSKQRPTRCFWCVGKARFLPLEDPRIPGLIHEFHGPSDLTKHFRRRHLGNFRDDVTIQCPVCKLPLEHKMHLQNHALRIHGTVS